MSQPARVAAELVAAQPLSSSVRSLQLLPSQPLEFRAGQWVNVYAEVGGALLKRAYSIANAPRDDGVLELAVTRVAEGALSPTLHELPIGARIELDGPHGFFVREDDTGQKSALFVGAGTGLSPLRAMLQAQPGDTPPMALLFGCRTPDDVLWANEQRAWQARGVRVDVSLSRAPAEWVGRCGYVQDHVVELARELHEPDVYICGLSKMVKAVRSALKQELGYDRRRIHSERYD